VDLLFYFERIKFTSVHYFTSAFILGDETKEHI